MSFSDIPPWIYALALWYASGIYTIGAMFAAVVWERKSLPTTGRYWVWIIALAGFILFLHVLIWRKEDFTKGFVLTDCGARRLKKKVDRYEESRYKLQRS